jgi:multiple sugar transport system permease protein
MVFDVFCSFPIQILYHKNVALSSVYAVFCLFEESLINTYIPLILPQFFGGAFYIVIVTQFFKAFPNSLIEAAKIDGATEVGIYTKIILPLSKAPLATVAIFTFFAAWSDFLGPLLYLNDANLWTLSLGLQQFMGEHAIDWSLLMAASSMFIVPIVIVFFFAQNYFVEGIVTTGLKG